MRRLSFVLMGAFLLAAGYGLGLRHQRPQTGTGKDRRVLYYVDPMHPAYKSDRAGIAPDCGMQLKAVFAGDDSATAASNSATSNSAVSSAKAPLPEGAVSVDDATQRMLGIRLAAVERSSSLRLIRAVGRVLPEDTRIYKVNSGVDGFIRDTYNDSVGTRVRKDQRLASYYAPEFIAAASGFLAASERVTGSVAKEGARSIQNYTDRLRNLGMSEIQIKAMATSRKLPDTIDVVSPADGFILARYISAGQHFTHEMEFYSIADLSHVWVAAEVSAQDAACLHPGGLARAALPDNGQTMPLTIADSLPQSEPGGGTVKLRLQAKNTNFMLRPDMLVDVEMPVRMPPAVTVPSDAVLDSGASARVYVERGEGVFEPRTVATGWRFGERVEILRGLRAGERVVSSATFLVDSESKLKAPASQPITAGIAGRRALTHAHLAAAAISNRQGS